MRSVALAAGSVLLVVAGCASGSVPATHPAPASATSPSGPPAAATAFSPTQASAKTLGWHLPVATARQALIKVGPHTVVLAGGMLADDTSTDRVFRIDLTSGQADPLPRLVVPVHDAAGGQYVGRPAVFGGGNATEQSVVQSLGNRGWRTVNRLPTTRSDLSVAAVRGGTLVLGGYDGAGVPRTILRQSGTTGVQPFGRLRIGVRYAATAVFGSSVYVFGGEVAGHELGGVQRVDARTGVTRVVARLPKPLGHAAAMAFGPRLLLIGGRVDPNTQTSQMWWFTPATGRFAPAGELPRALSDASVVRIGHAAYLLGGEDPGVTDRVVRVAVR